MTVETRMAGLGLAILALAVLAARPASALVETDLFSLDGSIRTIAAGIDNYDFEPFFGDDPADAISQTLLRLVATGRPEPRLDWEIHGVQSLDATTAGGGSSDSPIGLVPGDVRYRAIDASLDWTRERHHAASLFLDRASFTVRFPRADLTIGRQAITFGKAYFWNPLDVFLPFDPRQFDQEYKPGVDAVRLAIALGAFSGIDLVGAAGRTLTGLGRFEDDADLDASWFGSAVLGRIFGTAGGFDLALQGGKIYGGHHVGAGATGEAGPLEVRVELAQLFAAGAPPLLPGVFPDRERTVETSFSSVAGIGRRFERTLTLETEYFYNGAGDADDLDASQLRSAGGGLLQLGEHFWGFSASYEILPIVIGTLATIVAVEDPSIQILPRLLWSAADEAEVLAGAIVSLGERPDDPDPLRPRLRSEFGSVPDVYYVEAKLYF